MSSRAVSGDPKQVVIYVREFLQDWAAGVLGCGKHFPGLGEANLDTHHELPSVENRGRNCGKRIFIPIALTLRRELPMIMVRMPLIPRSRTTSSRLRSPGNGSRTSCARKLPIEAWSVSDDLEMGGVLKSAPVQQAAVEHIRAGGDLCLICHQEELVLRSYEALVAQAGRDAFARRVRSPRRACWRSRKKVG